MCDVQVSKRALQYGKKYMFSTSLFKPETISKGEENLELKELIRNECDAECRTRLRIYYYFYLSLITTIVNCYYYY